MKLIIDQYAHSCIIQDGPMAGNKHSETVSAWQVEMQEECEFCGEVLATPLQIIAHIYGELT